MSVAENTGAQMLAAGSWQVDPVHSVVEFRVRHMMIAIELALDISAKRTA